MISEIGAGTYDVFFEKPIIVGKLQVKTKLENIDCGENCFVGKIYQYECIICHLTTIATVQTLNFTP